MKHPDNGIRCEMFKILEISARTKNQLVEQVFQDQNVFTKFVTKK